MSKCSILILSAIVVNWLNLELSSLLFMIFSSFFITFIMKMLSFNFISFSSLVSCCSPLYSYAIFLVANEPLLNCYLPPLVYRLWPSLLFVSTLSTIDEISLNIAGRYFFGLLLKVFDTYLIILSILMACIYDSSSVTFDSNLCIGTSKSRTFYSFSSWSIISLFLCYN